MAKTMSLRVSQWIERAAMEMRCRPSALIGANQPSSPSAQRMGLQRLGPARPFPVRHDISGKQTPHSLAKPRIRLTDSSARRYQAAHPAKQKCQDNQYSAGTRMCRCYPDHRCPVTRSEMPRKPTVRRGVNNSVAVYHAAVQMIVSGAFGR